MIFEWPMLTAGKLRMNSVEQGIVGCSRQSQKNVDRAAKQVTARDNVKHLVRNAGWPARVQVRARDRSMSGHFTVASGVAGSSELDTGAEKLSTLQMRKFANRKPLTPATRTFRGKKQQSTDRRTNMLWEFWPLQPVQVRT